MRSRHLVAALAISTLSLAGCGAVKVRSADSAKALHLEPKPADCDLDFLNRAPKRAYQEIAELDAHVTQQGGSPEVLREKACELGADAIIVIRDFVTNHLGHKLVAGMAIKYDAPKSEPTEGSAGI